jgi:hypothetical protein
MKSRYVGCPRMQARRKLALNKRVRLEHICSRQTVFRAFSVGLYISYRLSDRATLIVVEHNSFETADTPTAAVQRLKLNDSVFYAM